MQTTKYGLRFKSIGILIAALLATTSVQPQIAPISVSRIYGQSALVGIKLSVHHARERGEVTSGVAECVEALPASSFDSLFTELLTQRLTSSELQATEHFFATDFGQRYGRFSSLQVIGAVNGQYLDPTVIFSEEENSQLNAFARTSAGEKLMTNKVLDDAASRLVILRKIDELLNICRAP